MGNIFWSFDTFDAWPGAVTGHICHIGDDWPVLKVGWYIIWTDLVLHESYQVHLPENWNLMGLG